jgi:hypothetical protein
MKILRESANHKRGRRKQISRAIFTLYFKLVLRLRIWKPCHEIVDTIAFSLISKYGHQLALNLLLQVNASQSLGSHITYNVPWSSIRIAFLPAFPVPPSQSLYALNGSIVGLFCDTNEYERKGEDEHSLYPIFVSSPKLTRTIPCLGLGLVKSIDTISRTFVIMTPLAPALLSTVNTLVLGQLEIPPYLLYKEALNAPYLSSDSLAGNESGSRAMSSRNFVERHKEK